MRTLTASLLNAVFFIALGSQEIAGQVMFVPDPTPRLTVVGRGSIDAVPDTAKVTLGVYALEKDLRTAKSNADAAVSELLEVARSAGVSPKDVASSILSIEPKYSDAETPEFLGYEVSRSVEVTLRDLALLDKVVDQAIDAGANRQFNVVLTSSKLRELQDQAMSVAIEDARLQAARLAEGFGARLGPVRTIGPNTGSGVASYSVAALSYGSGSFTPGSISVRSELSVTFLLEVE
jgi:uncharacterized protein YggE